VEFSNAGNTPKLPGLPQRKALTCSPRHAVGTWAVQLLLLEPVRVRSEFFGFFVFVELGLRASSMLGKCSTTELRPQPQGLTFFVVVLFVCLLAGLGFELRRSNLLNSSSTT
jgi:hypothetical protein